MLNRGGNHPPQLTGHAHLGCDAANEASDKDSNETETLGACVVLITEGGI